MTVIQTAHAVSAPRTPASTRLPALLAFLVLVAASLGGCTKSYPNCDDDKGCVEKNEVCVDGLCRQCRSDAQCKKLDACLGCQANECVKVPGCCKSDLDCPEGRCVEGRCAAPMCSVNSDCPDGERCVNGRCVVPSGCTMDSQCPPGLRCKNGECTTACDLEPVYFDFNEHAVRLDQESVVRKNAECLKSGAQTAVIVEGHTDERGADEYNLALGERRAKSVANQYNLLGVKGVGRVVSFGEEKSVCSESNESCWQKNRRAETTVR